MKTIKVLLYYGIAILSLNGCTTFPKNDLSMHVDGNGQVLMSATTLYSIQSLLLYYKERAELAAAWEQQYRDAEACVLDAARQRFYGDKCFPKDL